MVSQLRGDEPRLELGDSGEGVRELQFRLYRLGFYRQFPDGTYDMFTENAVRELQSSLGQDNNGEVTTDTWAAIVQCEQQSGLEYQYQSPSDAIDQLRYDLDHPQPQPDEVSPDGQWRWNGTDWVAAEGATTHTGQVSDDGQWRWNGSEWLAVTADPHGGHAEDLHGGQLSEDGQWRRNGSEWLAAREDGAGSHSGTGADGNVGLLSEDGYWRWSGTEWVATS